MMRLLNSFVTKLVAPDEADTQPDHRQDGLEARCRLKFTLPVNQRPDEGDSHPF